MGLDEQAFQSLQMLCALWNKRISLVIVFFMCVISFRPKDSRVFTRCLRSRSFTGACVFKYFFKHFCNTCVSFRDGFVVLKSNRTFKRGKITVYRATEVQILTVSHTSDYGSRCVENNEHFCFISAKPSSRRQFFV